MSWGKYEVQSNHSLIRLHSKLPFRINTSFVFLFTVTLMILTTPFAVNDVFGNTTSDQLTWQMVFISSDSACSNYHFQMMHTYYDIAKKYLKLYELKNYSYDPICITEEKYLSDYENPSDMNLIILVYDKDLGKKELHGNQMGGLYIHNGVDRTQNHAIIICDCPTFNYSSPVWILTHELSHLVLTFAGYDVKIIEDLVHENDIKYDECLKQSTQCTSSYLKLIAGSGGYAYSVMPLYEPAIGVQTNDDIIIYETKSPIHSEINKIITMWHGKGIISEQLYSKTIGYFVEGNTISSLDDVELILKDEPIDNAVTWEQMMDEITPKYWASQPKTDESMNYLSKIPSNMIPNNKNILSEEKDIGLPGWFIESAVRWEQDLITDKEFYRNIEYLVGEGIIEQDSSSVFKNLLDESTKENTIYTLPEWFVANAGWWSDGHITATEFNNNMDYLIKEGIIESHSLKVSKDVEVKSTLYEIVSVEPLDLSIEIEGIQGLIDFVNSITVSGDLKERDGPRLMKNLDTAVTAFDIGKIENGCNNLENYFTVIDYLIDTNKIVEELGQTLIDAGDEIRIDSCQSII